MCFTKFCSIFPLADINSQSCILINFCFGISGIWSFCLLFGFNLNNFFNNFTLFISILYPIIGKISCYPGITRFVLFKWMKVRNSKGFRAPTQHIWIIIQKFIHAKFPRWSISNFIQLPNVFFRMFWNIISLSKILSHLGILAVLYRDLGQLLNYLLVMYLS